MHHLYASLFCFFIIMHHNHALLSCIMLLHNYLFRIFIDYCINTINIIIILHCYHELLLCVIIIHLQCSMKHYLHKIGNKTGYSLNIYFYRYWKPFYGVASTVWKGQRFVLLYVFCDKHYSLCCVTIHEFVWDVMKLNRFMTLSMIHDAVSWFSKKACYLAPAGEAG